MNGASTLRSRARWWTGKGGAVHGAPPGRAIVAALMLAVAAFVAATVIGTLRLRDISSESRALATNVMPCVIALTTIRERLGELVSGSSQAVDGASRPPDIDRIESEVAAQSAVYESHQPSTDRAAWLRARGSMNEALANARRAREELASGRVDDARSRLDRFVRPSASAADEEIWKLVQSNAMAGEQVAEHIDRVRRSATALLLALDSLCVLLSIVLATLALRAVSRHTKLIVARSHELEQFAARVAHDVRGPLAPVTLVLQRLRNKPVSTESSRGLIDTALRAVGRVTSLVDDLLAFARAGGERDRSARANVVEAVRATFEESEARAKEELIELRIDAQSADALVACPPGVLTSIISNLVNNAIKYMDDANERLVAVHIGAIEGALHVEVIDSGPGLPRGSESRVFEPYVRGRSKRSRRAWSRARDGQTSCRRVWRSCRSSVELGRVRVLVRAPPPRLRLRATRKCVERKHLCRDDPFRTTENERCRLVRLA